MKRILTTVASLAFAVCLLAPVTTSAVQIPNVTAMTEATPRTSYQYCSTCKTITPHDFYQVDYYCRICGWRP